MAVACHKYFLTKFNDRYSIVVSGVQYNETASGTLARLVLCGTTVGLIKAVAKVLIIIFTHKKISVKKNFRKEL